MAVNVSKVLKKKTVRDGGVRKLRLEGGSEAPKAKAKILGQEDGCVIIQVTCSCGEEIQVRCMVADLATGKPAAQGAA